MSSKQMKFDTEARHDFREGVSQIARAVAVTMGPTGRNVLMQKSFGGPTVTKDGVNVAKEVELPQPFENIGAKMINQVAKMVSDEAGDGTTTATVLARAIYREGLKHLSSGANAVAIQRGINDAARLTGDAINEMAVKCAGRDDLRKVATVSANNDREIGQQIAEAIDRVGAEGVVEVEEGKTAEITLEYVEGMAFDKGYLSPLLHDRSQEGRVRDRGCQHPHPREEDLEPRRLPPDAEQGGDVRSAAVDHRRGG